jgi:hypothetical protein
MARSVAEFTTAIVPAREAALGKREHVQWFDLLALFGRIATTPHGSSERGHRVEPIGRCWGHVFGRSRGVN